MRLDPAVVDRAVRAALEEDLGATGDVTTAAVVPAGLAARAHLVAREALVLSGLPVAEAVFRARDRRLVFRTHHVDGERVAAGTRVATLEGDPRPMLEGERTALNFLMRMCGIATAAARAVEEVAGTGARILDTRKTVPGLRWLDKYAVACGGAVNHRTGLFDAVMIKDTHLGTRRSVGEAVRAARAAGHPRDDVTVEITRPDQLEEAIEAGAGRVLLDNMSLDQLREAVGLADGRVVLEASGGLRAGALRSVAETGVDFLSLGYLTHSVSAADLAMELEEVPS